MCNRALAHYKAKNWNSAPSVTLGHQITHSSKDKRGEFLVMNYRNTLAAAAFAAAAMAFSGAPAQAAGPMVGFQKNVTVDTSNMHEVRHRSRCYWRNGRRYCGRAYRGSRYYGYGPGISLRFGFGPRYHRHHRHHRHAHRHYRHYR